MRHLDNARQTDMLYLRMNLSDEQIDQVARAIRCTIIGKMSGEAEWPKVRPHYYKDVATLTDLLSRVGLAIRPVICLENSSQNASAVTSPESA